MVWIGVLGPLRARVDGALVDLGGRRQRAVLARLATSVGHVVPVDRLVDDLWRADAPAKALASLQVYVSNLRRVLEPDRRPRTPASVVVSAVPGYALRLAELNLDASRFESLLRDAAALEAQPQRAYDLLEDALACWEGPAYAEFVDEPWAQAEAYRLEELRLVAIEQRARAGLALGRPDPVVPELERHVRAHPHREQAVQLLAVALYRTGRQADALAALRRARVELAEQLGVDPGPGLRQLEAALLNQDPQLDGPAPTQGWPRAPVVPGTPARAPSSAAMWPTAELGRLRRTAEAAAGMGAHVSWLRGEAGAGKSTLLQRLSDELRDAGWQVATGRCPEVDGAPPAWPWSEILRALAESTPPTPAQAEQFGPVLDQSGSSAPRHGSAFWLGRAVADYLDTVAARGPLLIVLEDSHRADGETLQVLRYVAVALVNRPLLLAVAYRPTEVSDELAATMAALAGAARSDEVVLSALDERAVAAILQQYVPSVGADLVAAVLLRTGGNPLFVHELARLISAEGPQAATGPVPPSIRHILQRRLARLPAPAQTVLRHAAVIGRDVDIDVLVDMDGSTEETVIDGLEAGVLAGLLVEPEPGRVRFAHVLMRDALYDETPLLRRTRLHNRTLQALLRRRPDDVAALGRHALAGLTPATAGQAIRHGSAAARQAAAMHAPREAATLWTGVLTAIDMAAEVQPDTHLEVLCGLAAASANAGNIAGARAARAAAVQLARRSGDLAAAVRALTSFDSPVTWTIRPDRAVDAELVAVLEETLTQLGHGDRAARSKLLSTLVFELEGEDDQRVDEASREALALARDDGDPALSCLALNARYFVALGPRYRHEVAGIGAELLQISTTAGLSAFQTQAHHILFQAALSENDLATARWHMERAIEQATTGQLGLILVVMAWFEAVEALLAGRYTEAEARYTQIAERMARMGAPNAIEMGILGRFVVGMAGGRPSASLDELQVIHGRVPDDAHDLLARSLLDAGRVDEARSVWAPHIPIRRDYFWLLWTVVRGENAVRFADRTVAEELYETLLPWAGRFAGLESGSLTLGPVDATLADLATLLGRPAAAAAHRAAALELARRVNAVPWLTGSSTPATRRP